MVVSRQERREGVERSEDDTSGALLPENAHAVEKLRLLGTFMGLIEVQVVHQSKRSFNRSFQYLRRERREIEQLYNIQLNKLEP